MYVTFRFGISISIASGVATDAANNPNTAATAQTVNVDVDRPTVTIGVSPASSVRQPGAFIVTITFTETVSGFTKSDVSLTGSAASTWFWSTSSDHTVYSMTIILTASGTVTISVAADVATDAAGNPNTAATSTINATAPVPPLSDRTPQIRDAIVDALWWVAGVSSADDVTAAHLAAIPRLEINRKDITALKVGDFDGLTTLTLISLSDNDLSSLPEGIFDGLTTLKLLYLGNNALTTLPSGIFDGLTALGKIHLGYNALSALPADIFDGLTVLESLGLSQNALTTLPEGIFDGLTALTTLWLSYNDLSSLPEGIFSGQTGLRTLYLNDNDLSSLPSGIFDGLTALTELHLYRNSLTTLPSGIFDDLTALDELSLSSNDLSSLPEGIFSGLTALRELGLGENDLSSLPEGIFSGLTALRELGLGNNRLSTLPADIFDDLPLTTLWLSYNDLSSLPAGIFSGQTGLRTLYLNDNDLSSLPEGIFLGLTGPTERLWLFRNSVSPLPLTVSLEKVGEGEFKAVAPTGAPFEIVLRVSANNGTIDGGTTTLTIPKGVVESEAFTVTRTPGTAEVVTVDIGDPVPGLPSRHVGYNLVKSEALPLEVISTVNAAPALGIVNRLDLATLKTLDPEMLQAQLDTLLTESDGSPKYLQAIALLESLLASMRPDKTRLLANYPNPFNPETWIPYHLANPSDVQITIYDTRGTVVRRLDLGHQREGYYTSRSRAAHWDGRNNIGERVASGIYFYQLQADNTSLLRKMVILK